MLKLTVLHNPFNTAGREIHDEVHIPGKTIAEYAQPHVMGLDEFVYACNGKVVEADFAPLDGDYLAICPVVGKSGILGAILSVGLSVLTGGIASGSIWGITNKFMAGLVASAVGFLGGQLINHLFPPPSIDMPDIPQSNPAYGWGSLQPQIAQGGALPIVYGTMRTAGIELAKHITSDGEKQYLNLLLTGGEGPIDAISDIMINDNPIENYKDIVVETRLGTNDQSVIENFGDTFSDQALNYELVIAKAGETPWTTHQTEGNAVRGLELTFEFPNGLYHMNNDGNLENASVRIVVEYWGVREKKWIPWLDETIVGSKNTSMRKTYRIDHLYEARYEVRCKCLGKSGTSTRDSTRVYWTQLSGIIYDRFCHPGKILVGIKALATEQLSGGDLTVTWKQCAKTVNVYNPQTAAYEQRSARNPAWACYDILHHCKQLKNIHTGAAEYVVYGGVRAGQLDYQAFLSWAEHCDVLKLNFEHMFDAASSMWEALKVPEAFGRGKVIMKGTRFSCVADKPSVPVQLFTVGNMLEDQFSKEYMSMTDRANAVEITFINKEKDYQKDAITVYSDDWDTEDTLKNPTQVTLSGCTDYAQAYAHGKYLLRINRLMKRTCSWEADIDALACQIGDQVLVSHDVPEWGASGRIMAAAGSVLTLDRAVNMAEGKRYRVIIRYQDDEIVTKDVVNLPGESDQIRVASTFDRAPQPFDIFAFGEITKEAKPFIIVDIARSGELTAALSGIEYVPAVYEESLDAPIVDYAPGVEKHEILSVSAAEETFHQKDGTLVSNINISWTLPRGAPNKAALFYSLDGQTSWHSAGSAADGQAVIQNVRTLTEYFIKVSAVSELGVLSNGRVAGPLFITGKDAPPGVPLGLRVAEIDSGVLLQWEANQERDIAGYNIHMKEKYAGKDKEAVTLRYGGTSLIIPMAEAGTYVFYLQAVDYCGNESEAAETEYEIALPPDVIGFDVVQTGAELDFRWQKAAAGCMYEIRADNWDYGARVAQLGECFLKTMYPIPGEHCFWIKAYNKYKRYSKNAALAKIQLLGDNARNVIYRQRYSGYEWNEHFINFHRTGDGLQLERDAMFGEYLASVRLPKKFGARNWINTHIVGVTEDSIAWEEADFCWESVEANIPWIPSGDITGATIKHQIAVKTNEFRPDIIESYPLSGSTAGEIRGAGAREDRHVVYEPARFDQGALLGDLTKLSWDVQIPPEFHLAFYLRVKEKMRYDSVFMTLAGAGKLRVGYDYIRDVFYLEDQLKRRNEARLDYRGRDYLCVAIVQTKDERSLFIRSFAARSAASDVKPYAALGAYTEAYCYNK